MQFDSEELVNIMIVLALATGVGYKYGLMAGICAVPGIACLFLIYGFWTFGNGNNNNNAFKDSKQRRKINNASSDGILETRME